MKPAEDSEVTKITSYLGRHHGFVWEKERLSPLGVSVAGRNDHLFIRISIERTSPGIRVELIRPIGDGIPPYPALTSPVSSTDYVDLFDLIAAAGSVNGEVDLNEYPRSSEAVILLIEKFALSSIEGSYCPFTDAAILERINRRIGILSSAATPRDC